MGKAAEWALTGDRISAAEAHDAGLVNRLTPHGESLAEAKSTPLFRQLSRIRYRLQESLQRGEDEKRRALRFQLLQDTEPLPRDFVEHRFLRRQRVPGRKDNWTLPSKRDEILAPEVEIARMGQDDDE